MADTYFDFDAFTKEADAISPGSFRTKGEEFTLPADLPAAIVLHIARARRGDVMQDRGDEIFDEFFTFMLGEDGYKRLLHTGIGINKLKALFEWIASQYFPQDNATGETTRKNS